MDTDIKPFLRIAMGALANGELPTLSTADDLLLVEKRLRRSIAHARSQLYAAQQLLDLVRRYRLAATGELPASLIGLRGFVYALFDDHTRLVKIGYAVDPLKRRKHLQTTSAGALIIIGLIRGEPAEERRIHCEFAAERVRREWFRCTKRLVDYFVSSTASLDQPLCDAGAALPFVTGG